VSLVEDTILDESITHPLNRKIPKIVHMTSKSRCMTDRFMENINLWRFQNYFFYFHDDAAMDRLLHKYWPEFPHLPLLQRCMVSGAAKADLWRLLVLWEYGGIYTDIDNAPGTKFQNVTVIKDSDDAWFVIELIGVLSQYFMAALPKHPYVYIAILGLLHRVLDVKEIGNQYVRK
jgi:mannosyltransferase OCH1-like enzyme